MAVNPTPSKLDSVQIAQRLFDESNDSIRMIVAEATGLAMELAASDGDSILAVGTTDGTTSGTQKAIKLASDGTTLNQATTLTPQTASLTSASTGVVIAEVAVVGMKTFNIVTKTTATIIGAQICTLEVSPTDSGDVWVATDLTVTPSLTSGVGVLGTPLSSIARRARVSIAAAITSGTFDIYLLAQGN